MSEEISVVAYLIEGAGHKKVYEQRQDWAYKEYGPYSRIVYTVDDLITVAQHQRIVDVLTADYEELDEYSNGQAKVIKKLRNERDQLLAALAAVPKWISVEERLPESGKKVLAHYKNSLGNGRTICANYIKAFTVEACADCDPDIEPVEYSEQDDCYYLLEGWYELIENWDDYSRISVDEGQVTKWMPLPASPVADEWKA